MWVSAAEAQPSASGIQTLEYRPAHIDTALTYFGPQDQPGRDNNGPNIKQWLNAVGLPQGNPYCAAFVSYCLEESGAVTPHVRSALASNFIQPESIDAKKVMYGQCVPVGAILIWRKGNTMFGHTGFVLFDWCGAKGMTIEGNTTVGGGSSIEGVWIRKRTIYPANYFRITNFSLVEY